MYCTSKGRPGMTGDDDEEEDEEEEEEEEDDDDDDDDAKCRCELRQPQNR